MKELIEDAQFGFYFIQMSVGSIGASKTFVLSRGPHGFHCSELGQRWKEQRSQAAVSPVSVCQRDLLSCCSSEIGDGTQGKVASA